MDDFRKSMLNSKEIEKIFNYSTPVDVFSNVNLRGGVNYFLWNANYDNSQEGITMTNVENGKRESKSKRPMCLDGADIFISDNNAISIILRFISNV